MELSENRSFWLSCGAWDDDDKLFVRVLCVW